MVNDEPLEPTTGTTFRLMYRSRDRLPAQDRNDEVADLFATARSNNQKRNITGALLLSGEWFVQVLEGKEADVQSLFDSIRRDPRHDGVELLYAGPAGDRIFAHWSMAKVTMDESDLPVIARISEISPASSRTLTPGKSRLLDVMRHAIEEAPGS